MFMLPFVFLGSAFSTPGGATGTTTSRPSALKKPGHQRAFSQGQVVDVQGQPVMGHSRVGSKTDFILPPGHREDPRPPSSGKVPSFRGHSRQASRYKISRFLFLTLKRACFFY